MDSISTVPASAALALRLKNLVASATVVALACAIYRIIPNYQKQLDSLYGSVAFSFVGKDFLFASAVVYIALLGVFYFAQRNPGISKSLRCWVAVGACLRSPTTLWREGFAHEDRVAVLSTLLKAFFAPMMGMSLMVFCMRGLENGAAILSSDAFAAGFLELFDRHGFWFLIQIILFVDVSVFTVGYLVELPRLRNEIRSVDPTLMGWTVALICYPPFNTFTGRILGSPVSDFPQFDNPTTHIGLNLALLTLMAIYASASVALGFKGSNLTHRGIVARGPYALIRHPAYICKNLAWWIGSIPLVSTAFADSLLSGTQAVASVVGWSMVYILRALTEEDHLRSVDGEYAAYASKVRYRFIPGVV